MKSAGDKYLENLGIEWTTNPYKADSILSEKVGEKFTKKFIDYIEKRGEALEKGETPDESEFYEFKNQTFESGIYASAMFDAGLFKKTCDWIEGNKTLFGKTILDVGCDTGIVSCFLAKAIPESTILSIDDGTNAIKVAKELAEKLGLANISFECINVKNVKGEYDTVFSSRTLHENLTEKEEKQLAPLKERCLEATKSFSDYLEVLKSHIRNGGNLIAIERMADEAARIGYKIALNDLGLAVNKANFEIMECEIIGGDIEYLTTSVAVKDENYRKRSIGTIIDEACEPWVAKFTYDYQHYPDESGDIILYSDQGAFIKGYKKACFCITCHVKTIHCFNYGNSYV